MSAPVAKLSSLRQLLATRFPQVERNAGRTLPLGVPAIDEATGGLPCGAVTEVVCAAPSCGGSLLIGQGLLAMREARGRMALVDAGDGFDPCSWPDDWLQALVWIRCRDAAVALRAADVIARDANFQLAIVDLRGATATELRKTPASFWYRLQRAAEPSDLALLVLTPRVSVPSAQLRLELNQSHALAALETARPALPARLTPRLQRQRLLAAAG